MKTPVTIFLVGFSGSGKSTVGPRLAKRLRIRFYDTDAMIERQTGRPISEIFANDGEGVFRQLETATIERLIETHPESKVVALGGGALLEAVNRRLVLTTGVLFYLSCSVLELYRRIRGITDRPLLKVRPRQGQTEKAAMLDRIRRLLDRRLPGYEAADIRVSTSARSVAAVVQEANKKLREFDGRN